MNSQANIGPWAVKLIVDGKQKNDKVVKCQSSEGRGHYAACFLKRSWPKQQGVSMK